VLGHAYHEVCQGFHPNYGPNAVTGQYGCSVCAGRDLRVFRGHRDDPCSGFVGWTGKPEAGKLFDCSADPHPLINNL